MARAKVTHSEDACMITFKGNNKNPEPSTGIIKFPGGHVEVSRCSDGTYWAHIVADKAANIVNSRVEYNNNLIGIPEIKQHEHLVALKVRIDGPYTSTDTL